jgi:hypothetical protein
MLRLMDSKSAPGSSPAAPTRTDDQHLEDLLRESDEAGVGDVLRVYENIERIYITSVEAAQPLRFVSGYSTDTLPA